jgi:hypothetical protein
MATTSLNGTRMRPVRTSASSIISRDTLFEFTQDGQVVSARYAGGRIVLGALVGVREGDILTFRYAQVHADGNLEGGRSECRVSTSANGLMQIEERFTWDSEAAQGVNVLEAVREGTPIGAGGG